MSQRADGGSDARRAVTHLPLRRLRGMQAAVTASGVSADLYRKLHAGEFGSRKYQVAVGVRQENKSKLTAPEGGTGGEDGRRFCSAFGGNY